MSQHEETTVSDTAEKDVPRRAMENTYTYSLGPPRTTTTRVCKTCRAAYSRRYNLRKKAS